jgi:hypothetical protein
MMGWTAPHSHVTGWRVRIFDLVDVAICTRVTSAAKCLEQVYVNIDRII